MTIGPVGPAAATFGAEPVPGDIAPPPPWTVAPDRSAAAPWHDNALRELSRVAQDAAEEGFAPPAGLALANARGFIDIAARLCRIAPAVYPTVDREVAIQFVDRAARWAVLILCDSDGGGACFVSSPGSAREAERNGRARFDVAEDLADFVTTELCRLERAMA